MIRFYWAALVLLFCLHLVIEGSFVYLIGTLHNRFQPYRLKHFNAKIVCKNNKISVEKRQFCRFKLLFDVFYNILLVFLTPKQRTMTNSPYLCNRFKQRQAFISVKKRNEDTMLL